MSGKGEKAARSSNALGPEERSVADVYFGAVSEGQIEEDRVSVEPRL